MPYTLFEDVNRGQARLMVDFALVQGAIGFALLLMQPAPLVLLSGAGYLSVSGKSQVDARALGFLIAEGWCTW